MVSFAELHHQEAVGLYDQALQFAHNGSCNLAIPLFKQAVADDQDYEDAWLELGICQIESSSYEDALDALKQVIRINPKSDKGYFQVARVSVELNLWDEALRLYRQAVAINPGNDEAQYGLGLALCKTGDIEGAQRTYRTLARLNPGRAHELYEVYPEMLSEPPPKDRRVEGTITLDIDPTTGLIAIETCPTIRSKTFALGSEPKKYCGPEYHNGKTIAPSTSRPRVLATPPPQ